MKKKFHVFIRQHWNEWYTASLLAEPRYSAYGPHPSELLEEISKVLARDLGSGDFPEAGETYFAKLSRRTEAVSELMRAVNASTDPVGVANAVVTRVSEWLPLTHWSIMAVEPDGVVRRIDEDDPAVDPAFKEAASQIADVVVRSGKAAVRSTTYVTDRLAASPRQGGQVEETVIGWPLVVSGAVVAVLAYGS